MPRYLVERTFRDGLNISVNEAGANSVLAVVGKNAAETVTWVHSYVTTDKREDVLHL